MVRLTPVALLLMAIRLLAAEPSVVCASEIPFRLVEGFIAIDARFAEGGEPLHLLLDSGASVSVLSDRTARRYGLPLGRPQRVLGVRSEAIARRLENVSVSADTICLTGMTLAADLSTADDLCGERVDGLVGADFFHSRIVQIDFGRRRIRLLEQAPAWPNLIRLPLKLRNQVLCAPVSVNGCSSRWIRVDTGCNEPLHWVVPRRKGRDTSVMDTIGFVSASENLALVSVSLGSRIFPRTEAVLHGRALFPGESGLLGTGLLSRFKTVTLDLLENSLLLEPVD
jgi:hypothetical protein